MKWMNRFHCLSVESNSRYFQNYILFCISFSLTHAAVNCVLGYSSTLLGPSVGGYANFILYFCYSFGNILIARPALNYFGPKNTVFWGLTGLLVYVLSFFVAVIFPVIAWEIFLMGACIGGIGAGILWVGQGVYFSLNCAAYTEDISESSFSDTYSNFAGYFAFYYLFIEVLFQIFGLIAFLFDLNFQIWIFIVFGLYSACAILGWYILLLVKDFKISEFSNNVNIIDTSIPLATSFTAANEVIYSMIHSKLLFLILPFQLCFGLSAGLVNFYINRVIVADTYGGGYVGLLMAIDTLSSALSAHPMSAISNALQSKWHIMIIGCCCFFFQGISLLLLSDNFIAQWRYLVPFYLVHGAARCVFENTNKALITDYFDVVKEKEIAFAAIYFASGLSAAFSFCFYQYMDRFVIALINTAFPIFAMLCYHRSYIEYCSKQNGLLGAQSGNHFDHNTTTVILNTHSILQSSSSTNYREISVQEDSQIISVQNEFNQLSY